MTLLQHFISAFSKSRYERSFIDDVLIWVGIIVLVALACGIFYAYCAVTWRMRVWKQQRRVRRAAAQAKRNSRG